MATSKIEDNPEQLQQYALQLASGSVLPMALKAAIELGVFEILDRAGPGAHLSPSEIAVQIPNLQNPEAPFALDHILLLLACHSVLTCVSAPHKSYGLAPVAKYFIRNQSGGSLAPMVLMVQDKVLLDMWYHLGNTIVEGGIPFDKAHGDNVVKYIGKDERFREVFGSSMRDFNPLIMERILESYDGFHGIDSLTDVGGGNGSCLNMIVSKYPGIKGTNFDLPNVIARNTSSDNNSLGIKHQAGDMFVSIPKADAIFMKWVLGHGWDSEKEIKLLKNCYEALPEGKGKVIVVDMVMPERPETASTANQSLLQFYLYMASMNPKGKGKTENDYRFLAEQAGFSQTRLACRSFCFAVLEFLK